MGRHAAFYFDDPSSDPNEVYTYSYYSVNTNVKRGAYLGKKEWYFCNISFRRRRRRRRLAHNNMRLWVNI